MKSIIQTRLIHWKKQWLSLLFWLIFPIIASLLIINVTSLIQEDSKIPVGFVLEENTPMAEALLESVKDSPLIRVFEVTENQARDMIERHELDSAFIIKDGYEQQIHRGNRNKLITSYKSDLSFAYTPVSEMVVSYVQEDAGKAKAAHTVMHLAETLKTSEAVTFDEIISLSEEIQSREDLLRTTFSFNHGPSNGNDADITIWNVWGLWAIFSILSTLLLFDWVIKERNSSLVSRFSFIRFSYKSYLLQNLIFYTAVLLFVDSTAALVFHLHVGETINFRLVGAIISFRFICSMAAFLLALLFKNVYLFYGVSFAITLFLAINSGAVLPIEGLTGRFEWLEYLNPLHPFLHQEIWNSWLIILILILGIWFAKGGKLNA